MSIYINIFLAALLWGGDSQHGFTLYYRPPPQSVPVKVGWTWVSASKYLVKIIAVRGLGLPY